MGGLVRSDDKTGGTLIEVAERCTYPTLTTKWMQVILGVHHSDTKMGAFLMKKGILLDAQS